MSDDTERAREGALAKALYLLDTFAGEGLGHVYGNGSQLDADTVCLELCDASGIEAEPGWWRVVSGETPPVAVHSAKPSEERAREVLAKTPHKAECLLSAAVWDREETDKCDCDQMVRAMLSFAIETGQGAHPQ